MQNRLLFGYIIAFLTAVVWGFELFLIRYLVNPQTPSRLTPETAGSAAYILCVILLAAARATPLLPKPRGSWRESSTWKLLVIIGLLGAGLNTMAFFGLKFTTSANAGILQRTDILFTLLLSLFLLKEPIRGRDWVAIIVMVLGVAAVVRASPSHLEMHFVGDSMLLAGAFMVSLNAVFIQRCLKLTDFGTIAFTNCLFITSAFLVLFLINSGDLSTELWAVYHHGWLTVLLGFMLALVFVLYYIALGLLPLWEVRIFMLLIPVTAAVFEAVFLGSRITLGQFAGMAAVMAGAASISLRGRAENTS